MNKDQYMKALRKRLRYLPKKEFDKAGEYFEEYFAEAGEEYEQQAILDLGTPEEAAEQILQNIAMENMEKPVKDVKHGMNAVWVGILAVFALPVALPFLLILIAMFILVLLVMGLVLVMLMLCGVAMAIAGPVAFLGGFTILTKSISAALVCFGWGFMSIGIGILLVWGMYLLSRKLLGVLVRMFGNIVKKRGQNK